MLQRSLVNNIPYSQGMLCGKLSVGQFMLQTMLCLFLNVSQNLWRLVLEDLGRACAGPSRSTLTLWVEPSSYNGPPGATASVLTRSSFQVQGLRLPVLIGWEADVDLLVSQDRRVWGAVEQQ